MTVDGHSSVVLMKGVDGLAEGQVHRLLGQNQDFERREKRKMERLLKKIGNLHSFSFGDCL